MGQQPMGQQRGGQPEKGTHRTAAASFDDHLTTELRIALEDFHEVTGVAGWCAKECTAAGPELSTCARVCEDVADLAELNERLIARDSMFGPDVASTFVTVANEALAELERFQHHPQIAETMATIERTTNSCREVLRLVGRDTPSGQMARGDRTSARGGQMDARGSRMHAPGGRGQTGTGQQF